MGLEACADQFHRSRRMLARIEAAVIELIRLPKLILIRLPEPHTILARESEDE